MTRTGPILKFATSNLGDPVSMWKKVFWLDKTKIYGQHAFFKEEN